MALRREVVDFVRAHLLNHPDQCRRIGHVAMVKGQFPAGFVRVFVEMIDAVGVEQRRTALDAVHRVAFFDQKLGQISTVLTGNAGDQCCFFHPSVLLW